MLKNQTFFNTIQIIIYNVCVGKQTKSRASLLSLDALDRIPVGNSDGLAQNGQDDNENRDEGGKENDQPREDGIVNSALGFRCKLAGYQSA